MVSMNSSGRAREAGFDAVEVHAGHGYLISQFLSPYTNRRKDEWGGTLANRARFMREVIGEVMNAAGNDLAVLVKMNLRDGFHGGMELGESLEVAAASKALKENRKKLSDGRLNSEEKQEIAAKIREWEATSEWKPAAVAVMFFDPAAGGAMGGGRVLFFQLY